MLKTLAAGRDINVSVLKPPVHTAGTDSSAYPHLPTGKRAAVIEIGYTVLTRSVVSVVTETSQSRDCMAEERAVSFHFRKLW